MTTVNHVSPELAAAMRESRMLRDIIEDILDRFAKGSPTATKYVARANQAQLDNWAKLANLPAGRRT